MASEPIGQNERGNSILTKKPRIALPFVRGKAFVPAARTNEQGRTGGFLRRCGISSEGRNVSGSGAERARCALRPEDDGGGGIGIGRLGDGRG